MTGRLRQFRLSLACAGCVLALALRAESAPRDDSAIPDLTKLPITDVAQLPETPALSWNLGPTGARGWMYGADGNRGPLGSQILVTAVERSSPADGVLQKLDVLLGANGRPFTRDARRGLGQAVTESETAGRAGLLKLTRWRAGKTAEVEIRLRVMGSYGDAAPTGCEKSRKILAEACRFLADRMPPDGFQNIGGHLDALLLLAGGRPEHLDHVRRTAYRIQSPGKEGLANWGWGYITIFLAEYYLATGDAHVLPRLAEFCKALTDGQASTGSWGHNPAARGWTEGYGEVNAVGLACFTGLVLARECGVKVDEAAMARSTAFFRQWAGRGNVPYGDHPPWMGGDDNGKTAQAAVVYALLGDQRAVALYSALVAASWEHREVGHAGNFFSYVWGPLGAARAGQPALVEFMRQQRWYYDLARRWDGSLVNQPWPQRGEGPSGFNHYAARGPLWGTGGMALVYALPDARLRILGAARGRAPDRALVARSIELTVAAVKADIDAGDLYRAKCRLDALTPILPAGDTRCAAWLRLLADPANEPVLASGEKFHQARALAKTEDTCFVERFTFDRRSRGIMTAVSRDSRAGAYQAMAARLLQANPMP